VKEAAAGVAGANVSVLSGAGGLSDRYSRSFATGKRYCRDTRIRHEAGYAIAGDD